MAAASGGSGGAIKAGQAFVGLALDQSEFVKGLETAQKRLKTFAGYMARTGVAIGAMGSVLTAPLLKLFADVVDRGSTIKGLADRFGSTAEEVSVLATGFEAAGGSLEEFGGSIDSMNGKIIAAADGYTELSDQLRGYGLEGARLMRLPLTDRLEAIANAVSHIQNSADQANFVDSLGLTKWLPQLKKGVDGVRDITAKGAKGSMSTADAERSAETMKAYTETWQSLKYTLLDVGKAFLPTSAQIKSTMDWVTSATRSVRDFIDKNQNLIITVGAIGAGLVAGGAALVGFGYAASLVATGVGAIVAVASGLGTVLAAAVPALPFIALGAAVAFGVYKLAELVAETQTFKDLWASVSAEFAEFGGTFKTTWSGIVDAVGSGDLSAAFEIAMAGLDVTWKQVVLKMTDGWIGFKDLFVDGWHDSIASMEKAFISFATRINLGLATALAPMLDIGAQIAEATGDDKLAKKFRFVAEHLPANVVKVGDEEKAAVDAARKEQQDAADAARLGEHNGALQQLVQAQQSLAEMVGRTKEQRDKEREDLQHHGAGGDWGDKITAFSEHVKGITSGPANLQLGYADTLAPRQLDAMQNVDKNTKALPEVVGQLKDLNAGLRFK
jgi:hypothetical protein